MNIKHDQFIGIYENAFSKDYCDKVIEYFDIAEKAGYTVNRQQLDNAPKKNKEDLAVFCSDEVNLVSTAELQRVFNETLWESCYQKYAEEFWPLKDIATHSSYHFKIQKTEPGQGYHVWHSEATNRGTCTRILAWNLYLNDVEEGGETEFIFQHIRIKPKAGTFVIFPAGFTHTHRGNPPLSNTKYIVTGWIEF
jgi:hypothetical protein